MIAGALDVPVAFENGFTWSELVDRFREGKIKLLHPVALTEENRDWGRSGDSHFRLPFALVTKEAAEQPVSLNQLIGKNLAIPKGWSILDPIRKAWPNINIVEADSTLDAIEQVIAGDVEAALDNETILRYIAQHYFMSGLAFHTDLDLGLDNVPDQFFILSPDAEPELRILLDRAIDAFEDEHHNYLEETWLNTQQSGGQLDSETVPSGKMIEIAADPDQHGQLISIDIDGEENVVFASATGSGVTPLYLGIVTPVSVVLEPFLSNISLSLGITAGLLFLLLPLSWLFANPIVRPVRQLAVENDKVRRLEFDEVQRVSSSVKELDELSESMVDMVASIQAHEIAQRDLMDAFIRLIAQAIDDKSPYTGGHCERVPELALMLADAATQCTEPAFQDFALKDGEEWREYRIAAWLHDCGKITTPEHIVDKGSKLETIYNRIHEIRTRFEVLSRDAEIHYWESLASSPEKKQVLEAELKRVQKELQDDFEFVAECNVGGEFLDESKQQRLLEIAEKTWQRRFNDQLGLSPVEELRQAGEPS
ncbi:MAG: transporter substrate-binding domain-containing protein, partial [Marinobacter alexandrii]